VIVISSRRLGGVVALALTIAIIPWHTALAKSWTAAAGDWNTGGNWSPPAIPVAGEAVTVSVGNAVISLTNETPLLGSFTMTAGKLVFSNWTTRLMATNVTISGGTATVANAFADTDMSNRVWIVCSNDFTLSVSGRVDVSALVLCPTSARKRGTVGAGNYGGGGGHGGKGAVGYYNGGRPSTA